MKDKNTNVAEAVVNTEAAGIVLSQMKPSHLYQGFAVKTSWKGVKVEHKVIDPFDAADNFEANLLATEAIGIDALKSDLVGRWDIKLNCVD
jgi:hypothetical protein